MKIIASFDDGTVQDLQLAELMNNYMIPTVFYFPSKPELVNEVRGRTSLNAEQRQSIAKHYEIGSHTRTHPLLTRINEPWARDEIGISRTELRLEFGGLGQNITKFCYPRGYASPLIEMMVQEAGYTSARGVTVGYLETPENPFYEQTTVHVGCDRKEYGGISWFDYAIKMLEQSTDDSTFHLFGHSWEIDIYPKGWEQLEDLCKILNQ